MNSTGRRFHVWRSLSSMGPLLVCFCLAGCRLDPFGAKQEVREVRTSASEDIRITRGDLRRLQEDVNTLSVRLDRLSGAREGEGLALRDAVKGLDSRVGQASSSILAEVDRRIAELDAKRVADKNQLVAKMNSLVDRVNTLSRRVQTLQSSASKGGETVPEKGFDYTVQEGDSLWGIASKYKEYGVTVDAIRRANNMGSTSDRIVPGQKLFIPVKQ